MWYFCVDGATLQMKLKRDMRSISVISKSTRLLEPQQKVKNRVKLNHPLRYLTPLRFQRIFVRDIAWQRGYIILFMVTFVSSTIRPAL